MTPRRNNGIFFLLIKLKLLERLGEHSVVIVKKKTKDDGTVVESNEALMRRFQRKAVIVFKSTKKRDTFQREPNRNTRRKKARKTQHAAAKYELGVKTGKIKPQTQYQSRSKKRT